MSPEKRIQIANLLFYITLAIEIILMIVEKSELPFSYESYVFRLTFVLSFAAVCITPRDRKRWIVVLCVLVFTFACYRLTGRNELLRYAVFVMAAENIDLDKTMKSLFYVMLAGFGLIALGSVTGLLGKVTMFMDYGREAGEEMRYVFGFGHPNTLWGCAYALMLAWLFVYGRKARWYAYAVLLGINVFLYKLTVSRTAFLIGIATVVLAVIVRYVPAISAKKLPYVLTTIVTPFICAAFSTWAAYISPVPRYEFDHKYYKQITRLDELLNNRMHNLYRANNKHAGALETWKLFSDRMSEEYFDMGWVRLVYWYGIIPALLICALVVLFIYICYTRKDLMTTVLILSISIYTVVEATFVSVYIGRNIMLPILGVYLGMYLERKKDVTKS